MPRRVSERTRAGVRLGVGERERAAPRAAEDVPRVDAELLAYLLDVLDQVPGRVPLQLRVRRALPRAALVEEDDAVGRRVEVAPVVGDDAAARAAVQEDDGLPLGVAGLLVIDVVDGRDLKPPCVVGFDRGIEFSHARNHTARAAVRTKTARAPASSRARAQAEAVAPVVNTSSTSRTLRPRTSRGRVTAKAPSTLSRRARASMPARGARCVRRARGSRASRGRPAPLATADASRAAWLKPRSRSRAGWSGTGTDERRRVERSPPGGLTQHAREPRGHERLSLQAQHGRAQRALVEPAGARRRELFRVAAPAADGRPNAPPAPPLPRARRTSSRASRRPRRAASRPSTRRTRASPRGARRSGRRTRRTPAGRRARAPRRRVRRRCS